METHVSPKGFIQINIVVADIEKAAEKWADLLGIEVPKINYKTLQGNEEYPYLYRGEKIPCKLKCADIKMPGFVIELHEPDGGDSSFQEFIDKHGNGVHHLGFQVGDKRDDIIAEMEADGYKVRTVGYYPGSSWTIVDTEDTLGVNLNIKPIG